MKRAAEQKKVEKRKTIAKMREELQQIMEENSQQIPERQLDPSEFVVDKEYADLLQHRREELLQVGSSHDGSS